MTYKKGLDGREQDISGRIREKNGASIVRNMLGEYPEMRVFSHDATLTSLKRRHKVPSLDELRKIAALKARAEKYKNRQR